VFSALTGPSFAARPVSDTQYGLQVISKEANFVTVRVNKADVTSTASPERTDLLCSVRALLKKIKQTVLVGDNVQVASIDWTDKRGMVRCKCFQHEACTPSIYMYLLRLLLSTYMQQLYMHMLLYINACLCMTCQSSRNHDGTASLVHSGSCFS